MPFSAQPKADALVVKVHAKRLDARAAPEFKSKLTSLIQEGHTQLVVDMTQVDFLDSSGLGAMIAGLKLLGGNGEIVLCGVNPKLMSLLKITRVDKLFRLFATPEEALTGLTT
ncbi:MAG: STAS domain-containing protein [Candidatus Tectomicrobia bacterium]|uniref:Anti-sigma factor antagonist n=1 Tax=Tectimicrobiota bacterium TaxID=2528274 RepID=A0A937W0I0_UNCTE|nr:STAS domain-containing protein [Candidatus Tectomicrobia bacterium]